MIFRNVAMGGIVVMAYAGLVWLFYDGNSAQGVSGSHRLEFTVGFETGDFSELGSNPFTNSGNAEADVVTTPTHSGGYALAMQVFDADAGTAVRTRIDNDIFEEQGYVGGENLPDEATYSAWFFIPEYVDLNGGDPWNVFQFKQTWPSGGGYTRRMIDAIKLWDRGGDYGFTVKSNIDDQGNWDSDNFREWQNEDLRVAPDQWFQIKVFRKYGGVGQGHLTVWVDDTQLFDLDIPTEMYGGPWDDWGPWRRQWTVNNYVTGAHQPNTHTLYVDDLAVQTADEDASPGQ